MHLLSYPQPPRGLSRLRSDLKGKGRDCVRLPARSHQSRYVAVMTTEFHHVTRDISNTFIQIQDRIWTTTGHHWSERVRNVHIPRMCFLIQELPCCRSWTSSIRRRPQREELTEGVPLVLPYGLGDVVGEVFRDASWRVVILDVGAPWNVPWGKTLLV